MKNKTLGTGLLVTIGVALVWVVMESSLTYETVDAGWTLISAAYLFFGIWGGIRLKKQ